MKMIPFRTIVDIVGFVLVMMSITEKRIRIGLVWFALTLGILIVRYAFLSSLP